MCRGYNATNLLILYDLIVMRNVTRSYILEHDGDQHKFTGLYCRRWGISGNIFFCHRQCSTHRDNEIYPLKLNTLCKKSVRFCMTCFPAAAISLNLDDVSGRE